MSLFLSLLAFSGFGTINPSGVGGYFTGVGGTGGAGLARLIRNTVTSVWLVAGLASFTYLLIGGFKYITAGGDQKAVQEATKQITNAVTGLVIIIASYAITIVVSVVLGVDILNPVFKGP